MMQGVDKVYEKSASAAKSFEIFPLYVYYWKIVTCWWQMSKKILRVGFTTVTLRPTQTPLSPENGQIILI